MNAGDVQERLIQAAEIEEAAAQYRVGPAKDRSLPLPYEHSAEDRKGWGDFHKREELDRVWKRIMSRPTARQISEAEEAVGWYALVVKDENREALAAWARCMASNHVFQDWCQRQNIHPVTGTRRKNRAIADIVANITGKAVLNDEIYSEEVLSEEAEIAYFESNIARLRTVTKDGIQSFADDLAFQPIIAGVEHDFSWYEARNKRRREIAARKKRESGEDRKTA